MKFSKKILSVVLAALMAVSMMPLTVFADGDVQLITDAPVDGDYYVLTEGIWYIDDDTNIERGIRVSSGNVTVNLDNHTLNYSSSDYNSVFYVTGGNLTVNNGTVTGGKGNPYIHGGDGLRGGAFAIGGDGTLVTMNNVTISENRADWGGAIFFDNANCTAVLNNCAITNNRVNSYYSSWGGDGGAIFFDGGAIELNNTLVTGNISENGNRPGIRIGEGCNGVSISGNTQIYDNIVNNQQKNIFIDGDIGGYGNFQGVSVTGELGEYAKIGVTMASPSDQPFTNTAADKKQYNDPAYFISDSDSYVPLKNTDGQLMMIQASNITATGYSGVYDGNAHGISVTVNSPSGSEVNYGTTEGTYNLSASPTFTNIGSYPVYYQTTVNNRAGTAILVEGAEYVDIKCSVSFNASGGSGTMESVVTEARYCLPENGFTAPQGKLFAGWSDGTRTYSVGEYCTLTDNTTFSAVWVDGVYATFAPNGGTGDAFTSNTVAPASKITIPSNTFTAPAGKLFSGWSDGTSTYQAGSKYTLNSNTTFNAVWINGITITFNSNGGSNVPSQLIAPGSKATQPSKPTKAGYTFLGWYLGSAKFSFNTAVTQNITLIAHWVQGYSEETSFDDGLPDGWTKEGDFEWEIGTGDYSSETGAHSPSNNAKATRCGGGGVSAWLIMPEADLTGTTVGTLNFWYVNRSWSGDIDEFGIYYRVNGGEWQQLFTTGGNAHDSWTEGNIDLPSAMFTSGVEIGFKATDYYGYGVGLDDVLLETASASSAEPNNGVNITVADTISENFYLDDEYYGEDSYVSVNYNHNSNISETTDFKTDVKAMNELAEHSDASSPYNGSRIISVLQAPAQSTEKITINVYANEADAQSGKNVIDTIEYSVYDYCRAIINGNYEENLKELAKSTLDYAAAAQTYFSYNTGNMATKDVSGDFYGEVYGADLSTVAGITSAPSCIKSASVVVKSDLEINLLSKTPIDVSGATIDTTNGGNRFNATSYQNGDYYVVHIQGIEPSNMDNTITVHTSEGDIIMTANAVIKIMSQSSNTNLATLAKAMYLYGVAANNYFA
ncbi:MAG: InlB B-repeat-containing protein [Eubacterium sp.]|nr:InlB B-repeat-containing protein [Eubacterium sp.]